MRAAWGGNPIALDSGDLQIYSAWFATVPEKMIGSCWALAPLALPTIVSGAVPQTLVTIVGTRRQRTRMVRNECGRARHQQTDDCGHRKDLQQHLPLRRRATVAVVRGRNEGAPRRQCGARMMMVDCCAAGTPHATKRCGGCAPNAQDRDAKRLPHRSGCAIVTGPDLAFA
jgi:hypothetical protein